ncbi:hypothetical protein Y032_0094g2751 [Ancylostoma ceylanicum]|uniref:Uncharacterized protein n=1 Tax=Ancylostoma ceylanicum TaxID=53326 RepID=A0A016TLG7_9BILA|nr:hypothetical protein Y032_0094g2751 [Ancylostoma ceylanicum]
MTIFRTSNDTTKSGLKKKRSICCGGVMVVPVFAFIEGISPIIGGVTLSYRRIFLEAYEAGILAEYPRPVKQNTFVSP